jgi:flagellar hook-associated protein 1 FlgK
MGIEIGKRSLGAFQQALVTTGHNLNNAATEGYSRQTVEIATFDPLYVPQANREEVPGQIGQGSTVTSVKRIRDELLDGRIVAQEADVGYWNTRDRYVAMLEAIYTEPADTSIRTQVDMFWDSWQELSLRPDDLAARQAVIERGNTLVDSIKERYRQLESMRTMVDQDIRTTVEQVNDIVAQIAELNEQIEKAEALGDDPNDLYDRRDLLTERLGALIPITVEGRDPDEFQIHTGGQVVVQGKQARRFSAVGDAANDGLAKVVWADTGSDAVFLGGTLGALVELRDVDIRDEIRTLDTLALTFTDLVNENHRDGYGLNGQTGLDFFQQYPAIDNIAGNYDRDGDGAYDSSYVYRFSGENRLEAQAQVGIAGVITLSGPAGDVQVPYYPTDTVADVVARINNSGAEVTARLDREGKLELRGTTASEKGNPDFVIRRVEDSGEFLAGYAGLLRESGPAGAYDWGGADAVLALRGGGVDYTVAPLSHPSAWVGVSARIANDPSAVAAGFGQNGAPADSGDGSAAIAIASLRNQPVMVGGPRTFDDFFAESVARMGLKGEQAQRNAETQAQIAKDMRDMRSAISGVNIDEELANMIKFQHGYAAAAKFIQHFDQMLDTIINRMGV